MKLYVVVAFLEDDYEMTFSRKRWPLHITLLGNFFLDTLVDEYINQFLNIASKTATFKVQGMSREMFGVRGDVPVVEVEYSKELRDLHTSLVNAFGKHPENKDLSYRPHVSNQVEKRITPGEFVAIDSMALVKLKSGVAEVISQADFAEL